MYVANMYTCYMNICSFKDHGAIPMVAFKGAIFIYLYVHVHACVTYIHVMHIYMYMTFYVH